jgi:hypothetical protein
MEETNDRMEEEQPKVHNLPRVVAGTDFRDSGDEPPSRNWLLNLPRGTVFLAHETNAKTPLAEEYCILEKTSKTVLLHFDDHRGQGNIRVDAGLFIKYYVFIEILGKVDIDGSR